MIVVADASPLNYLILIGEIELLPLLYRKVLVPRKVFEELQNSLAPAPVLAWASKLPVWCEICELQSAIRPDLTHLDGGECDAIHLALERQISLILLDDRDGREAALKESLEVAGTLATLEDAAHVGLINFRSALARLEQTNFRISSRVRAEFLERNP